MKKFFTSESVTEGHPDKICDQISDSILDAILAQDPYARVACEVATTTGLVLVMGEVSTTGYVDIPNTVRKTIRDIGYDNSTYGFDCNTCAVLTVIDEQSSDIAMGVNNSVEHRRTMTEQSDANTIGAGDQGMMFGYACDETEELMPMALVLSHKLTHKLAEVRKNGLLKYLRPDGKAQVTIEYIDDVPSRVEAIVVSSQHSEDVDIELLRQDIKKYVIDTVIPFKLMDDNTKIYINPTGRFVRGGPNGDSGLTGRKIIVDTYGGYSSHGGGSFSGKDPTKVDRSAAYYARYVAKHIVAAGLAKKCELQLAYAIGVANPVSIMINTFGTGKIADDILASKLSLIFDFRPQAIIKALDLRKPQYLATAAYGHFGRAYFRWEQMDKLEEIKAIFNDD